MTTLLTSSMMKSSGIGKVGRNPLVPRILLHHLNLSKPSSLKWKILDIGAGKPLLNGVPVGPQILLEEGYKVDCYDPKWSSHSQRMISKESWKELLEPPTKKQYDIAYLSNVINTIPYATDITDLLVDALILAHGVFFNVPAEPRHLKYIDYPKLLRSLDHASYNGSDYYWLYLGAGFRQNLHSFFKPVWPSWEETE